MVDELYFSEFWRFLEEFEKTAKKEKRKDRPDLSTWLHDPQRRGE